MTSAELQIGEIVQIDPKVDVFGGCLAVVTEIKSFGFQGYVTAPGVKGAAYIRLKHGDFVRTGGMAEWVID